VAKDGMSATRQFPSCKFKVLLPALGAERSVHDVRPTDCRECVSSVAAMGGLSLKGTIAMEARTMPSSFSNLLLGACYFARF
jgi:hypothetical protein